MKMIYEHTVGGDGGVGGIYLDGGMLVASMKYPVDKILEPVMAPIDMAFEKIEAAIPGDWDKAILEPIKEQMKAELVKMLSE